MLDIKVIRNNPELIKQTLANHTKEGVTDGLLEKFNSVDTKWRAKSTQLQELNTKRNQITEEIALLFKQGKKDEANAKKQQVIDMKSQIEDLNAECNDIEKELKLLLFSFPNILDPLVPLGGEENNKVIKEVKPVKDVSKPLSHSELGVKLDLIDFERGAKVSGSRGYFLKGLGAKLMRAIRDFTLDTHTKDGYIELLPPTLINEQSLYGLGKIPFFSEDMYKTWDNLYLTATEEFALTAMHQNEVLDSKKLPLLYTSSTQSWRYEAGSAGKDVGGILRVHYFWNTELVNFTTKDTSKLALDNMCKQVEKILQLLKIPYRIVLLASGDTGAASTITYDFEVWVPSQKKYREISSCSNCLDFQSRGLGIKYYDNNTKQNEYVHTLNGTGTSLNRLWIAIVENYQQEDGSIKIPELLIPYMGGIKEIKL